MSQRIVRKNYQADINSGVQIITKDAIRDVKQSLTTVEGITPKSVYKSASELLAKKDLYDMAERQRRRDQSQHRRWKEELGLDIVQDSSLESDDAAEIENDSVIQSSEHTRFAAHGHSITSHISEASTSFTLPEMDEQSISNRKEWCNTQPEISKIYALPSGPRTIIDSLVISKLGEHLHTPSKKHGEGYVRFDVPELGENPNIPIDKEGKAALSEIDGSSRPESPPLTSIHHSQVLDDDLEGEPFAWAEHDEDELRIDSSLDTVLETRWQPTYIAESERPTTVPAA